MVNTNRQHQAVVGITQPKPGEPGEPKIDFTPFKADPEIEKWKKELEDEMSHGLEEDWNYRGRFHRTNFKLEQVEWRTKKLGSLEAEEIITATHRVIMFQQRREIAWREII